MKNYKILTFILSLLLLGVNSNTLANETHVVYFNPDGGKYYHRDKECKAISSKYYSIMMAISEVEAISEEFYQLRPCQSCCISGAEEVIEKHLEAHDEDVKPFVLKMLSSADPSILINTPGEYMVGKDLEEGLYTISIPSGANTAFALLCDQYEKVYSIQGKANYTFFFPEGAKISLNGPCILRSIDREWVFQEQGKRYDIINARYLSCVQMPAYRYEITNLPGTQGYVRLSMIDVERGIVDVGEIEINDGKQYSMRIPLSSYYFVEFVNCRVYIEKGNG